MISRLWDTQVSLTYLRGLEVAELKEIDMPIEKLVHFLELFNDFAV